PRSLLANVHRIQGYDGGRHSRVGDHDFLVADFPDLEALGLEPELPNVNPIIAFTIDENDREAAALVRGSGFRDLSGVGGRLDLGALYRFLVRVGDATANDVGRDLGARRERRERQQRSDQQRAEGRAHARMRHGRISSLNRRRITWRTWTLRASRA